MNATTTKLLEGKERIKWQVKTWGGEAKQMEEIHKFMDECMVGK